MKNLETIRRVGKFNRIVLPKDFCERINLYPGNRVSVSLDGNSIKISPIGERCHSCNAQGVKLLSYKGHFYCEKCAADIGWIAKKLQG